MPLERVVLAKHRGSGVQQNSGLAQVALEQLIQQNESRLEHLKLFLPPRSRPSATGMPWVNSCLNAIDVFS